MGEENRQTLAREAPVRAGELLPNRFNPGEGGRPAGAVNKQRLALTTRFVERLAMHFHEHGDEAFDRALAENPVAYLLLVQKTVIPAAPPEARDDAERQITLGWEEPERKRAVGGGD